MEEDKRLSHRLEMLGYVPGEITVLAPVAIRDLSVQGAQVELSFPLLLNSVHEMRLHLRSGSVVLKGRVVHCRIADLGTDVAVYRAGIEFIDVHAQASAAITAHLERLATQRRGAI